MSALTVLSYGAGQDSWAILQKLAYDIEFYHKYVDGTLMVIMSDTGDEHPETYKHIEFTKQFCEKHNILFVFITKNMGYHSESWPGLRERYRMSNCVGSKAFPKTCTDNLKIKVIYRYLERFLTMNYKVSHGKKKGIKEFAERYGKIKMMIGFARGEEGRVAKGDNCPPWMQKSIERLYPLIDIGYDRHDCQKYTTDCNNPVPIPSNCMVHG